MATHLREVPIGGHDVGDIDRWIKLEYLRKKSMCGTFSNSKKINCRLAVLYILHHILWSQALVTISVSDFQMYRM